VANRPSWDEYFLEMARVVARRSTCLRRKIGAVLVRDRRILATGYNGAPSGLPHCEEVGCQREDLGVASGERQEICRALHAEQNAIIQGALHGVSLKGAVLYCTNQPCITCAKMLINAGVKRIVYVGDYPDPLALEMLTQADIELVRLEPSAAGSEGERRA
jgi:dCMP deaminase